MGNSDKKQFSQDTEFMLANLSQEYQSLLVKKAMQRNSLTSQKEISPEQILKIDMELKEDISKNSNVIKKRNVALYKFIGLVYVIVGLLILLYTSVDLEYTFQTIALLIISLGGVMLVIPYFLELKVQLRRNSYKTNFNEYYLSQQYKIIEKWNELEKITYSINSNLHPNRNVSSAKLVELFYKEGIIQGAEKSDYLYVLQLRNTIVHGNKRDISQEEILYALNKLEKLISKFNDLRRSLENSP